MKPEKWHVILILTCILIVVCILVACPGDRVITIISHIPGISLNATSGGKSETGKQMDDSYYASRFIHSTDNRTTDAEFYVYTASLNSKRMREQNVTIFRITDNNLHEFPKFEQFLKTSEKIPDTLNSDQMHLASVFPGNISEYYSFLHSICNNRTRQECYADVAVFDYNGQYYFISEIIPDTAMVQKNH